MRSRTNAVLFYEKESIVEVTTILEILLLLLKLVFAAAIDH